MPTVPPNIMNRFGFIHVAREVWYNSNQRGDYVVCGIPGQGSEDRDCHNGIDVDLRNLDALIEDHVNYLGISTRCN